MQRGYRSRWTRRQVLGTALGASAALWAAQYGRAFAAESPSGTIALPRAREIALVKPDGSEDRTLLSLGLGEFIADVALAPDGQRVAFGMFTAKPGDGTGGSDIAVAAVDGGGERSVVVPRDRPGMLLAAPQWSPDGAALVFEAVGLNATGQAAVTAEWAATDGSGRRTVATAARYPSFSPDGQSIVYTKALPTGDALWVQPLDGSPGREIVPESAFLIITYPRFSPDGQTIAFTGVTDATPSMPAPFSPPGVSPTVPKLLPRQSGPADFRGVARHGFPAEPFAVPVTGGEHRRLAPFPIDDAALAWSPDGGSVAVSGANGLFVIGVQDGSVRRVTENGSFGAIDWR